MLIARTIVDGQPEFAFSRAGDSWITESMLDLSSQDLPELISKFGIVADELANLGSSGNGRVLTADGLLCPVMRPSKMLAIGLNYADHVRETGATIPERPVVFAKYPNSLADPYGEVNINESVTEEADYETELGVVIGRRAKRVRREDALSYVFGYTVANDVSARDWQRKDAQFSRSKSADSFCPIGPWITSSDEVEDPMNLRISSSVNGEVRQDSSTRQMIFDVPALIEFLTATITLEPGDVLLTGTPPGVGLGFKPPRFLGDGDVVECTIEGLGTIRNTFVKLPIT